MQLQSKEPLHRSPPTEEERTYFRLWLQRFFADRCRKNPSYSLRAFAKHISMDASSLSQILNGRRRLSRKASLILADRLGATPKDIELFGLGKRKQLRDEDYTQLNFDSFAVISDWYHYALLELTFVEDFKNDPKWMARQLSLRTGEVHAALERLKRLGLLTEENGTLKKTSKQLTNRSNINTSAAHRELQKQLIGKALNAVDDCPQEQKDITSMTMAIDVRNIEKARLLTQKFRRELCALLEEGSPSQVYNLGIQLYPISKENNEENL